MSHPVSFDRFDVPNNPTIFRSTVQHGMMNGPTWHAVVTTTRRAIESGALQSIDTRAVRLQQDGVPFIVRIAVNLERKRKERKRRGDDYNPFLPPERALTVGPVGERHVAVLNKFNVVPHHLLVVTRAYEHQERLLTREDFSALWQCLSGYPSLGFYNGGTVAGASQRHKHLQVVPLPLFDGEHAFPFAALFNSAAPGHEIQFIRALPFRHAFARLDVSDEADSVTAARHVEVLYRRMLAATGVDTVADESGDRQGMPYNLLATRRWLFLAPRTAEFAHGVSINGLGYAGSLFVPDEDRLQAVRTAGPLNILAAVSVPG